MSALRGYHLPAATDGHECTIMAWPTSTSVSGEQYDYSGGDISHTRSEMANIIRAIAKYEPLHLFVRDQENGNRGNEDAEEDLVAAKEALRDVKNVTIHTTPNVHSLWARDTAPVFVRSIPGSLDISCGEKDTAGGGCLKKNTTSNFVGTIMSFNQWGKKNAPTPDSFLAATAAEALN